MNKKRDLIDRGQIQYTWWELSDGKYTDGVTLQSVINSMPTVDAVEVVHGRWDVEVGMNYNKERICPVCNKHIESNYWNYCPNCGEKMDGENNGK